VLLRGSSGSAGLGQEAPEAAKPNIPPESQEPRAGYLGLSVDDVPAAVRAQTTLDDGFGLSVVFVVPGGPSDNAGLRRYDIVTAFDEQRLAEPGTLRKLAAAKAPGDEVTLKVLRRGEERQVLVTIGDLRDAPEGLVGDDAQQNRTPVDSLLELFELGGGLERSDFSDSISALLNDLRKRSGKGGILRETIGNMEHLHISTSELDIVILNQGKDGPPWISAHAKDGASVFTGFLGKGTPLELRQMIDRLRQSELLPSKSGNEDGQ
ncbi:MAG: PDZ domain-containing protein, partial [Verrucomicrobia bacterium]|nr:PDZ domain-containing protein [Verrucomicrobiota bacterium]